MLTRLIFLTSLVLVATVFLTGAWPGPIALAPQDAEPAFVVQSLPLDADILASGLDGTRLLRKAAERLSWQRAAWLKTKIRQTMTGAKASVVVEGFLQRGPNHCARLEMNLTSAGRCGQLTVVSDGKVVAQAQKTSQEAPKVVVERLFEESPDKAAEDAAEKEETLDRKGCGGPGALLRRIQSHLRNVQAQTGLLGDQAVVRITGEVAPDADAVPRTLTPIRFCHLYLDAKSLWPYRVEWRGSDGSRAPHAVVQIEFLEPEINRELSDQECVRMFSYRPN